MATSPMAIWIRRLSIAIRSISLALLFGGSIATVVAAVTLVKAAEAAGVPVMEAASNNAPVFIVFAKIALGAAIALLAAEAMDFALDRRTTKLALLRYGASFLAVAATMVFSLGIVPPMEALRPYMKTDEKAHQAFKQLHETSRAVFSLTILFALVSMLVPAFDVEEIKQMED